MLRKLKIFLETSAISSLEQPNVPQREVDMRELWELLKNEVYDVVISPPVIDELKDTTDLAKRELLFQYINQIKFETIEITKEMHTIARTIIENGIIPENKYFDALHIACAIATKCDCIVSYNFRHINKITTIQGAQEISIKLGHGNINIVEAKPLLIGGI